MGGFFLWIICKCIWKLVVFDCHRRVIHIRQHKNLTLKHMIPDWSFMIPQWHWAHRTMRRQCRCSWVVLLFTLGLDPCCYGINNKIPSVAGKSLMNREFYTLSCTIRKIIPLSPPFFRDPSGMSVRSISIGGDRRQPILRPKKPNMAIANPSRCVDDYSIETSHLCRSSYPFWGSNPDFTHPHMTIIVGNLSSAYWLWLLSMNMLHIYIYIYNIIYICIYIYMTIHIYIYK